MASCYEYALNYMYRIPKSEEELKIYLLKKWFSQEKVTNTIDILKKDWYVDDKNVVKKYISSEVIQKWRPLKDIKSKLKKRWIKNDIINNFIDKNKDSINKGMKNKIREEIKYQKEKWLDGFTILKNINEKWYPLYLIKQVV